LINGIFTVDCFDLLFHMILLGWGLGKLMAVRRMFVINLFLKDQNTKKCMQWHAAGGPSFYCFLKRCETQCG